MRYLVLLLVTGVLCAQTPRAKKPAHPDIGEVTGDCLNCHRESSKEVVADWDNSKHGSRMVPCVTCHGAVGAQFVRRPESSRCVACHAEAVATLRQPAMKGKDCFSCHAPHSLNPHKSLHAVHGGKKS